MLPIRLETSRFRDGHQILGGELVARSSERETVIIEAPNLENPICLKFINCRSESDFAVFYSRFGDLERVTLQDLKRTRAVMHGVMQVALTSANKVAFFGAPGTEPTPWPEFQDEMLRISLSEVALTPELPLLDGIPRLRLKAAKLTDFMWVEVALAVEVSARSTNCAHCGTIYLTGALTGRRGHAKFCSDRCRVAAMRVRNAGQGSGQ